MLPSSNINTREVWHKVFSFQIGDKVRFSSMSPKGDKMMLHKGTILDISKLDRDFYFIKITSENEPYLKGTLLIIHESNLTWIEG